jgi:hypothetical protein
VWQPGYADKWYVWVLYVPDHLPTFTSSAGQNGCLLHVIVTVHTCPLADVDLREHDPAAAAGEDKEEEEEEEGELHSTYVTV